MLLGVLVTVCLHVEIQQWLGFHKLGSVVVTSTENKEADVVLFRGLGQVVDHLARYLDALLILTLPE